MSASYVRTPSANLAYLYTNDLIGIIPEPQINNGKPSQVRASGWCLAYT
jgi:hypothetical protein